MLHATQVGSHKLSFATLWAEGKVNTGKIFHHLLPCLALVGNIGFGGDIAGCGALGMDESPCTLKLCLGIAWGHQTEVSDFDKPQGKNVQ